ncbi:hypothetical protein GP486_001143 [Trichoglossum hirsutum]|uniref:C2H2-type domain-containing protein n=1 Tax=Trichoglossum hirsutum TaxID=265104 RepID=A0A9P8LH84_9PEZI|nr:hypothetical protein GP486_001143 [Trichoglossum hirsutum]
MDKHDRPYKCMVPTCSQLRGFTYENGLKKHEREVHKLHMEPGDGLYCPHPNCVRSEGRAKPFGRKENLDDHLRRKHKDFQRQAAADRPLAPKPVERKRARVENPQGGNLGEEKEELREELKRLRASVEILQRKLDSGSG